MEPMCISIGTYEALNFSDPIIIDSARKKILFKGINKELDTVETLKFWNFKRKYIKIHLSQLNNYGFAKRTRTVYVKSAQIAETFKVATGEAAKHLLSILQQQEQMLGTIKQQSALLESDFTTINQEFDRFCIAICKKCKDHASILPDWQREKGLILQAIKARVYQNTNISKKEQFQKDQLTVQEANKSFISKLKKATGLYVLREKIEQNNQMFKKAGVPIWSLTSLFKDLEKNDAKTIEASYKIILKEQEAASTKIAKIAQFKNNAELLKLKAANCPSHLLDLKNNKNLDQVIADQQKLLSFTENMKVAFQVLQRAVISEERDENVDFMDVFKNILPIFTKKTTLCVETKVKLKQLFAGLCNNEVTCKIAFQKLKEIIRNDIKLKLIFGELKN